MSEKIENTLTSYLGHDFQQKLFWQLLVEPEFAEKTVKQLEVSYFDDPSLKRLYIICLEYLKEYGKMPNLQNNSIKQAIFEFKTPNNAIEEETLFAVLDNIKKWNEMIINQQMMHDGDVIRAATINFIKQQEYRKIGEHILHKTQNGEIKQKQTVNEIEERFTKITEIGKEVDDCEEVIDNIDSALRKEFRKTIPTGIEVIDAVTGGGLGKSEIGIILAPSGVGKTTILTKIANTAYEMDYNVAQIVFEDSKDQIKRKHYSIWSRVPLDEIDDRLDETRGLVVEKVKSLSGRGKLVVKRFNEEDTTIIDVKNWILAYQKKFGITFDLLVLDYLDCLESHKKTNDRNEAELVIVKSFERMASDLDIPAWSAIQSNRSGFDAELVEAQQSGGNIKRVQKAHFFMSVAKTPDQKESNLANIRIIKARFASDGQTFKDAIYNNNTMEIRIEDSRYKDMKLYSDHKKYRDEDVNEFNDNAGNFHAEVSKTSAENELLLGDMMSKHKDFNNIKDVETVNETETVVTENIGGGLASIYGLTKPEEPEEVGTSADNPKIIDETPELKENDDLLELYEDGDEVKITPEPVPEVIPEPVVEVKEETHVKHDYDEVRAMLNKKSKVRNEEKNK